MREFGFPALGAGGQRRGDHCVVGSTLIASGPRDLVFWICHTVSLSCAPVPALWLRRTRFGAGHSTSRVRTPAELSQLLQPWINFREVVTPARPLVSVLPARGTQPKAPFTAQRPHRHVEKQLLPNQIVKIEDRAGVECDVQVAPSQRAGFVGRRLLRKRNRVDRTGRSDGHNNRRQTSPALQLDAPPDLALDEISITVRRDGEVNVHRFLDTNAVAQWLQEPRIVPVVEDQSLGRNVREPHRHDRVRKTE